MSDPRAIKAALAREKEASRARAAKRAAEEDARELVRFQKEQVELQKKKARQVLAKFREAVEKGDDEGAAGLAVEAPAHLLSEPLSADGMTLLHKAAARNLVSLTYVILQRSDLPSALVSMLDIAGRTALHCAAPSDTTGEICAKIVGHPGCKIRALDNEGRTALEIAQKWGMAGAAAAIIEATLPPLPPAVLRRLKGLPEEEPKKPPSASKKGGKKEKGGKKKKGGSQPPTAEATPEASVELPPEASVELPSEATAEGDASAAELTEAEAVETEQAAVKIQSRIRGRKARKSTAALDAARKAPPEQHDAATKMQANFRGRAARKSLTASKLEDEEANATAAAAEGTAAENDDEEEEEEDEEALAVPEAIELNYQAGLAAVAEGRREDALRLASYPGWPFVNELDPKQGRTLLHWAAAKGYQDVCAAMLGREEFLIPDAFDKDRATALHLAVANRRLECVEVILSSERFTAVNARDLCDRTALHLAALRGDFECYEIISAHEDCDLFLPDCSGKCAAEYAVERGIEVVLPEAVVAPVDL